MEKTTRTRIAVGLALALALLGVIVVLSVSLGGAQEAPTRSAPFEFPSLLSAASCPAALRSTPPPLVLVSLDGFHPLYLRRGVTPTLVAMGARGVAAPYMVASFPSLTFPNHYSIVTGLYPESHGIVANSFYDSELKAKFSYSTDEVRNGRWWGGEPIWNTAHRQGLLSATYFWPGSEAPIGGRFPDYFLPFDAQVPPHERADKVFEWLSLPKSKRPSFITLYYHEPDKAGHKYGPDSSQVTDILKKVDKFIEYLLQGLQDRNLLSCVNIMVVSDHGMAAGSKNTTIHLDKFLSKEIFNKIYVSRGALGRIQMKNGSEELRAQLEDSLSCARDQMKMFRTEELPTRLHYSNNHRIGDYVLMLDEGYSVNKNSNFSLAGWHGYDTHQTSMEALFIAYGPSFKANYDVKPFQNVELYNLMCDLLNIAPSENNGTSGLLNGVLKDPPGHYSDEEEWKTPQTPKFPNELELQRNAANSDCKEGDATRGSLVDLLNMTESQTSAVRGEVSPFGVPRTEGIDGVQLLLHPEHITGYSLALKSPLWTSFVVRGVKSGNVMQNNWVTDVRLPADVAPSCASYREVIQKHPNWTLAPLFPPEFSRAEPTTAAPSTLVSNACLFSLQLGARWGDLMHRLVPEWARRSQSPLHVVVGPVFKGRESTDPAVPTDYFAILMRCSTRVQNMGECPGGDLDTRAFIYPQKLSAKLCLKSPKEYAALFGATIRDVERVTRLRFFADLASSARHARLQVITNQDHELW